MNTLEIISQSLSQQKKDINRVESKLRNAQTELVKQFNYISQTTIEKAGAPITLNIASLMGSKQMVAGTIDNVTITQETLTNALPSGMTLSDFITSLQNADKTIRIVGVTQTDTNPMTWNAYATVRRQMVGSIEAFIIECSEVYNSNGNEGNLEETSLRIYLMLKNSSFENGVVFYAYAYEYELDNVTVSTGTTSTYGVVKISNGDVDSIAHSDGLVAGMDHTHSNYLTTANAKTLYGMPVNQFNSASVTLKPNQYHQMTGSTSRSSFSISFSAATDTTICNEYFVEFPCYYNNMTLTVPTGVKWANGTAPTMNSGSTYQISFINNLAVYTEFR